MQVPFQRNGFMAVGGVLVAAGLLVTGVDQDASSQVLAGTCVDRDAAPAACSDPAAVYQVLTTVRGHSDDGANCPHGDYFEHLGGPGTLCLGYNVAAGDCMQDDPEGPAFVPCTPAAWRPTFRVLSVVEDRATAKACRPLADQGAVALTYTVPAKTLCIAHLPIATPE